MHWSKLSHLSTHNGEWGTGGKYAYPTFYDAAGTANHRIDPNLFYVLGKHAGADQNGPLDYALWGMKLAINLHYESGTCAPACPAGQYCKNSVCYLPLHQLSNPTLVDTTYESVVSSVTSDVANLGYAYAGVYGNVLPAARSDGSTVPLDSYVTSTGHHSFATNDAAAQWLISGGYQFQARLGHLYAAPDAGTIPVYGVWSPTAGYALAFGPAGLTWYLDNGYSSSEVPLGHSEL
jgi:hypothetical protein